MDGRQGGHARLQAGLGVVDFDDGLIRDHVLIRVGALADLDDPSQEDFPRKRVDLEDHLFGLLDPADIGFVDCAFDAQAADVVGDFEKHGSIHAGGQRLAFVDEAGDDDAVHRREDIAMGQVGLAGLQVVLGLAQGRLGGFQRFLGRGQALLGRFLGLFGDQVLGEQVHVAVVFPAGQVPIDFGLLEGGLGDLHRRVVLLDRGDIVGRVDAGQDLAFLDERIEIRVELDDFSGDFAAHVDLVDRGERAGRDDLGVNVAAGDGFGCIKGLRPAAFGQEKKKSGRRRQDENDRQDRRFSSNRHGRLLRNDPYP